jgi:disulfide bond formation protein DsbB
MTGLRLVFSPRGLIAATGMCALGLVAGGVVLAQTMNLAACPLCVLQRMLYLLLALEAALALSMARASAVRRLMALVMAATAFTGAWIAAYQTWLQRFAKGVSWAGAQWPLLFEASGLCSEAGWKFLGLSIAEWSLVAFTSMTIAMLAALLRKNSQAD